ncbi:KLTH0C10098p [Lachancea thermotolerans CBS 6340]|uniref:KLTH0C10098p n=1 Tax=Lachancea thermotolerans (strain ATCC 56472 / CBS 6340 / NRRL Y-8284) TaxID=559295 RepID=C5DEK9_LACTC|nr:KLTH0C10098p [Lachancea thermotolerans CBS 6340]CAR22220.1 KLTH0C10098p [Lachancea thermotolerans CBS 6340]
MMESQPNIPGLSLIRLSFLPAEPDRPVFHAPLNTEFPAREMPLNTPPDSGASSKPSTRRRRRKVIKSCTFCRQRKMKCDQQKPMCGSCVERKLSECIYTDGFNFQLTSDELFSRQPNVTLLRRIQELEEQLSRVSFDDLQKTGESYVVADSAGYAATSQTCVPCGPPNKNDILDLKVLRVKDGRYNYYGPTSIRVIITASGERFVAEYSKVWRKVEAEVNAWKNVHGRLLTMEHNSLESPNNAPLLESIIQDLPSYEAIQEKLREFFDSPLHDYFQFLDKDKVFSDFARCFIPNYVAAMQDTNFTTRSVIMLLAPENNNVFTIAVVIMILCLNHYKTTLPVSIERLIVSLVGFTTSKSVSVERTQFLLLLYLFRAYNGLSGSGSSHVMSLVSLLCSTAFNLGLHQDIRLLYAGQEHAVGSIESLENLWYWTLFVDLYTAFDKGLPMNITPGHYDDTKLPTNEKGRISILRNFLHVGRKCMHVLFDREQSPDLLKLNSLLLEFVEQNFRPICYYTDSSLISQVDLFDLMILSPTFSMLANFYDLTRVIYSQVTIQIKNGFVKCILIAISILVNTILRCYELDRDLLSEDDFARAKTLSPSLNLCVLILNSLPIRALNEIYGLMFYKITLFEKGLIVSVHDSQGAPPPNLDDLKIPNESFITFNGIFDTLCYAFDKLWKPENTGLTHMLSNSHYYVIMMALERVNRTIFQVGLDSRAQVEVNHKWPELNQDEVPEVMVKMLADEVWNNYSTGFTDLINMDAEDFLVDFDMDQN